MANAQDKSSVLCSICMEVFSYARRTVVRLQCSHLFHLDCIGSAFNASGAMQCPNCRSIENGIWRRFESDGPKRNAEHDDDSDEEDVRPLAEMPSDNQLSLVDSVFRYIILRKNLERIEQRLQSTGIVSIGIASANRNMTGPHLPSEIAGPHVLPHDYGINCSCMFGSLCNLHMATRPLSAQDVPSLNHDFRIEPARIPYLRSNGHQNVVEPQLVAQSSFGPTIISTSFRGNGSTHDNLQLLQPRNYPSPAVRNMAAGRMSMNNLQGWSPEGNIVRYPEQTRRINHSASSSGFFQSHPQPPNYHHNDVQEGSNTEPHGQSRVLDLFK